MTLAPLNRAGDALKPANPQKPTIGLVLLFSFSNVVISYGIVALTHILMLFFLTTTILLIAGIFLRYFAHEKWIGSLFLQITMYTLIFSALLFFLFIFFVVSVCGGFIGALSHQAGVR